MRTLNDIFEYFKLESPNLNWVGLEKISNSYNIEVKNFLVRAAGLSFNGNIYISNTIIYNVTPKEFFFILLHEIAHNKRNIKYNSDEKLVNLGKGDFEVFFQYVINEEVIADRYAKQLYFYLNRETTDIGQNLDQLYYQNRYRSHAKTTYDMVPKTINEYNEFLTKVMN